MTTAHFRQIVPAILLALAITGCSHGAKPRPLAPQFGLGMAGPRSAKEIPADPLSGSDQPGALNSNNPRNDSLAGDQAGAANGGAAGVQDLSKTVQENVTAPGERAVVSGAGAATTEPANGQNHVAAADENAPPAPPPPGPPAIGQAAGQFFTVDGLVADVNGTPITARKVMALAEPELAARAKDLDPQQFRRAATIEVKQKRDVLIYGQLEYTAAERNLDQKDKDLADALTMNWKQQKIREAGGSLELARRAAERRGERFDDLLQEQYRVFMSQIYYQRKIYPRVAVSAAQLREYYDRHRDSEFTDRGVAQFRLIRIDARKHDGRENALKLITELRNRIVKAGESFDAIARSVNDDPRLLKNGGDVGKIEQNSFAVDKVDQAVWATPDGEVTPVVDAGDAFYIAQVMEKKPGKVLPFEDEAVQQKITDTLRSQQFRTLREAEQKKLIADAVVRSDADMLNTAIDMAMQNYPKWAGK